MKKIIALTAIAFLVSCGNSEKANDLPKKVWMCDSILESSFDSLGNEMLTPKLKCDSVLQEVKK